MVILFWATVALIGYTYLGFPALVLLRGRLRRRPYRVDDVTPTVSLVVVAHNEAANLGANHQQPRCHCFHNRACHWLRPDGSEQKHIKVC